MHNDKKEPQFHLPLTCYFKRYLRYLNLILFCKKDIGITYDRVIPGIDSVAFKHSRLVARLKSITYILSIGVKKAKHVAEVWE